MRSLGKSDNIFLDILTNNKLMIQVSCLIHIKNNIVEKYISKLVFKPLNYAEVSILEEMGFYKRIYEEYINENFNAIKSIPIGVKSGFLTNITYSLLRHSNDGDEARDIINSNNIHSYKTIE